MLQLLLKVLFSSVLPLAALQLHLQRLPQQPKQPMTVLHLMHQVKQVLVQVVLGESVLAAQLIILIQRK